MKRTALYIGFPYTAGLLIASIVHRQLWFGVIGAVLLTAAVLICSRRAVWKYVLISTLSVLTACCVYWEHDARSVQQLEAFSGRENSVFSGEIIEISLHDGGCATYILEGVFSGGVSAKIKYFCNEQTYAHGDTLLLTGTPEALESSYVFDAESYYRSENIFLSMPMDAEVRHTPRSRETLRSILYEWRMEMTERIQSRSDEESGALMTGMLFGDKSAMSDSTKTSLYRTGIGHVLAVSGLHLDFLALCIIRILQKCKADGRFSFAVLALTAILFVICVGETVSVKRACIMILISQSAGLFYRRADMLNTISIAMLLLTLENPMVVHSAGFWLSFSGTFGIAVFAPYMTKNMKSEYFWQRKIKSFTAMCCVFLAVLPASMLYFREISLVSPIANLLMVPLCMVVLLLEVLAMLTGGQGFTAEFFLHIAELLSSLILDCAAWLASLPMTYFGTDSDVLLVILAVSVILIAVCFLCWRSRKAVCIAIAVSLAALCISAGMERWYQNRNFHIAVLGEERDCALVIRSGTDAVIIDMSGDAQAPDYVSAYLQSSGIRSVDTLFLCSPKAKNAAGYEQALRFCEPESVVSMPDPESEMQMAAAIGELAEGREILFHGAVITIAHASVCLRYNDLTYSCCRANAVQNAECDVLTIYGTSKEVLPDSGILLVLDERSCYTADHATFVGENNLELTLTESGKCRVRRMYADS